MHRMGNIVHHPHVLQNVSQRYCKLYDESPYTHSKLLKAKWHRKTLQKTSIIQGLQPTYDGQWE